MMRALLSDDLPRSRLLSALLLAIFAGLALAPFILSGSKPLGAAAQICYFIVLVASYDLLLGYTGIVSFAHTMFFGIGGYGVGLALQMMGASWLAVLVGLVLALIVGVVLAVVVGLMSLRVKAIFFSMITLAVASAFAILVTQFSQFTGGEDGLNIRVPELIRSSVRLSDKPLFGVTITGRIAAYYLLFIASLVMLLAMLRIVNSPFGRVLQAIRENDGRAEALGYRVVYYRATANALAAGFAVVAGALSALWLSYIGPGTTLSFEIMLDILLMVVIGGMGTIYGAVVGATVLIVAQTYLKTLMGAAAAATAGLPLLPDLFNPDRWLLWLGVLFVLSVYFFPSGLVGWMRKRG